MSDCDAGYTFKNWAKTITFQPRSFCQPTSEARVIEILRGAAAHRERVRVQGAGHSFCPLVATNDTLISLDRLGGPITVNGNLVTLPAGMRLKDAIRELATRKLAFKNLGSITEQSIAGAISTGTHGTGISFGSIPTQVAGCRLVDGTGQVQTITQADADQLSAARISLGALGVMTEVTLECVSHYKLEYNAYLARFDEVVNVIDTLVTEHQRMLLWWLLPSFGPTDWVVLVTKDPVSHPPGLLADAVDTPIAASTTLDRTPLPRDTDELVNILMASSPPALFATKADTVPPFRRILHFVADYDRALTIPLLPLYHRECEYAIPAPRAAEALRAMRVIVEENDFRLRLPVEARFVAQDDILLSPARFGPMCYIGASTLDNATEVFERFEPLMKSFGGRPHWGKNYTLTGEEVRRLYPDTLAAFLAQRDAFDPQRVFANSMLDSLFGASTP